MNVADEFMLSVDGAGRHWLWDKVAGQNAAWGHMTEKETMLHAIRLYRNAYLRVLGERNEMSRKMDAVNEILNPSLSED